MGLFDFVKDAGEMIFGTKEAKAENKQETEEGLIEVIQNFGFDVENLVVEFSEGGVVVLRGKVKSQEDKEKIVLSVGNIKGVSQVDDQLEVESPSPEATYYTVKRGDTLWKIAKENYGDGNKYMVIFEANKPMLKDPDKIYPDQVLRIPPLEA